MDGFSQLNGNNISLYIHLQNTWQKRENTDKPVINKRRPWMKYTRSVVKSIVNRYRIRLSIETQYNLVKSIT